jgi:exopolysaccharide biosynthesis WecB/TagA/CpsF family protein
MSMSGKFQFGTVTCSTHTIAQLLDELKRLLTDKSLTPRSILYINAHVYNLAVEDPRLAARLSAARIIAADGMAIVWAAPLFGIHLHERCNMTEAFRAFLEDTTMPVNTAILIGCSQQEAQAAAANGSRVSSHCRIANGFSGFLHDDEYGKLFSEYCDVDLIFLGMGTPKTEQITELATRLAPQAIVWAIGGGTIRIYAGRMKEAPALLRRLGMQWLHRLCSEPAAVWRRYLIGNPLFLWRIVKSKIRGTSR